MLYYISTRYLQFLKLHNPHSLCNNQSRLNGGLSFMLDSIFRKLLLYGVIIIAPMFDLVNLYVLGFSVNPIDYSIVSNSYPT